MTPNQRILEGSIKVHGFKGPDSRGEYFLCCPFCTHRAGKDDTKYKLAVNPGKGVYVCRRCNKAGRVTLPEFGTPTIVPDVVVKEFEKPQGFTPFESWSSDAIPARARPYYDYLYARFKYTDKTPELKSSVLLDHLVWVGAGFCPIGRYAGRVVFPLYAFPWHNFELAGTREFMAVHHKRAWVGFVARTIIPGREPKYLYPPGMDKKGNLWGTPEAAKHPPASLYLVEGVLDAFALYPAGVAAFGKNVSTEQLELLLKASNQGTRIIVCLDGDAWEEGLVLAARLHMMGARDVKWCKLPPKTDPGDLGFGVIKYIQGPPF